MSEKYKSIRGQRRDIQILIGRLLRSGKDITKIAKELGADEYLGYRGPRGDRQLGINVRRLVEDRVRAELPVTSSNVELKNPPEGWLKVHAVSQAVGISRRKVLKIAELKRATNPACFATYKNKIGRKSEHLAPDLVAYIYKEAHQHTPAPKGWRVPFSLATELNSSVRTVQRAANTHRAANPDWFATYTAGNGKSREHYAPKLVAHLQKEIAG